MIKPDFVDISDYNEYGDANFSYSKTSSVRGDLECAITKLSELIEKDFDLSISISDQNLYEDTLKDKEMMKDKDGVCRAPLAEKDQNVT